MAERTPEEKFPELFNLTDIDRRTCKRVVPMKTLVIGMPRTGTMSMRQALLELGHEHVYHMTDNYKNPRDLDMWKEALDWKFHGKGKPFTRKDWDQLLGHCDATIDTPTAAFMPELIEAYPEAKVIISMRDPYAWHKSVTNSIGAALSSKIIFAYMLIDTKVTAKFMPFARELFSCLFPDKMMEDRELAAKRYLELHDEVRQMVPADRLLEYKLGEGWERLCAFLGEDVPNHPFPRVNENAEFMERMEVQNSLAWERVKQQWLPYVQGATTAGVAALAIWFMRNGAGPSTNGISSIFRSVGIGR